MNRAKNEAQAACPCGSGLAYQHCCGPCHDGSRPAPTAEALMRSRYSAYALGLHDYLLATWHPDSRPPTLADIAPCKWLRLAITAREAGGDQDQQGKVGFSAWYTVNGRAHRLDEYSSFERIDGRWVYCDGEPPAGSAVD